jgi:hypothetical protein
VPDWTVADWGKDRAGINVDLEAVGGIRAESGADAAGSLSCAPERGESEDKTLGCPAAADDQAGASLEGASVL